MKTRQTMHYGARKSTFYRARSLRKNPTKAEEILWKHLRERQMEGVKFRRQHPARDYVIDFFSNEIKLVIEVDGEYHDEKLQSFEDDNRDLVLINWGMRVLRYKNEHIYNFLDLVLEDIRENFNEVKQNRIK